MLRKPLFLFTSLFSFAAYAQDKTFTETNLQNNSPVKTINSPKVQPSSGESEDSSTATKEEQPSTISNLSSAPGKVKDAIENILLNQKATSLMFDDEQSGNIDRAVESLKNNQLYVPDDGSADGTKKGDSKNEKKIEENEKSYIYLASIIYYSPQDWAVWINDQKITSATNDKTKELYLKSVQRDHIKVLWKLSISKWKVLSSRQSEEFAPKVNKSNQIEVEFELRPNQTFILSTNNVVEGRAVIALLKKKEEDKKAKENAAPGMPTTEESAKDGDAKVSAPSNNNGARRSSGAGTSLFR